MVYLAKGRPEESIREQATKVMTEYLERYKDRWDIINAEPPYPIGEQDKPSASDEESELTDPESLESSSTTSDASSTIETKATELSV